MRKGGLAEKLRDLVGKENVISDPAEFRDFAKDAGGFTGTPLLVIKPHSELEVSEVMRYLHKSRIAVVARGGGSSLTGAAVARGAVLMDMTGLNRILDVDEVNWRARVQPGIVLEKLNEELAPHGFFFPPDPASSSMATLGGAIAEGAGGLRCIKYGTAKHWVLSLRVVLPDGEVCAVGEPLMKNRAGYDLVQLFIGSEGTLALITEATLRLLPLETTASLMLIAQFSDWKLAGAAIEGIRRARIVPDMLEFIDRETTRAINTYAGLRLQDAEATLLIELTDSNENGLAEKRDAVGRILNEKGAVEIHGALDARDRKKLLQARRDAYYAIAGLAPNFMSEDVVVPINKLVAYLQVVREISEKHSLRIPVAGHAGDGNVHPIILFDQNNRDELRRANEAFIEMCEKAIELGGSITGEHGVGLQKRSLLETQFESHNGKRTFQLMKEIKQVIDPLNLMNPGKVFATRQMYRRKETKK